MIRTGRRGHRRHRGRSSREEERCLQGPGCLTGKGASELDTFETCGGDVATLTRNLD